MNPLRRLVVLATLTCSLAATSAVAASHRCAISFMNEILVASSALAAYLTISALFGLMRWMFMR